MGVAVITKYQNVKSSLTWTLLRTENIPNQNNQTAPKDTRVGNEIKLKQYGLTYQILFITTNLTQPGAYKTRAGLFDTTSNALMYQFSTAGTATLAFMMTLGIYHTDLAENPSNAYMCNGSSVSAIYPICRMYSTDGYINNWTYNLYGLAISQ